MIVFDCSHCGRKLKVPDGQAGKKAKCPRCGQLTAIPQPAIAAASSGSEAPTIAPPAPQPPAGEQTQDLPAGALDSEAATLAPSGTHPAQKAGPPARIDLPGYEILGELGRGGMGVIYKARQLQPRRLVAVKMILAGEYAGSDALARFHSEAESVARLSHPNIVQIHQVGEHQGRPYLTLEFVESGNLAQRLHEKPYDFRAAAELVLALARAVRFAHQRGIIHRDLKPANILLTCDGTPKITDFGLAKQIEGSLAPAARTQSGAILGTPSYMAPEQAEGKNKTIGPPADIYALGAILYELLSGRPPFQAETMIDTLVKVATEEPVPPRQLSPNCPRELETICLKCLRKNPSERYASAGELADDLRRWLDGEAIKARPMGTFKRVGRFLRRRIALVLLTIGCGILLFLTVFLAMFIWDRFRGASSRIRLAAERSRLAVERNADAINLKELTDGMLSFHRTYSCLPPPAITDRKTGKPLLSWRVAILPFIGEPGLYRQFKLDEAWDSPHNIKMLPYMPRVLQLPSGKQKQGDRYCFFQVFVGTGTAFETKGKLHAKLGREGLLLPDDFLPDGAENTLLIVETAEGVPWTKPVDLAYDPRQPLPNLGGDSKDDFLASMADGQWYFVKRTVSEKTLRALITRNAGDVPGNDWK
jgi:hypothetical protein